jgi:hypothetical protein
MRAPPGIVRSQIGLSAVSPGSRNQSSMVSIGQVPDSLVMAK